MLASVSYTHLDVYKRQAMRQPPMAWAGTRQGADSSFLRDVLDRILNADVYKRQVYSNRQGLSPAR